MKRYSELLEQWEQKAYHDGYGADWLADVGEGVKYYAMECEVKGRRPTFAGLIRYIDRKRCCQPEGLDAPMRKSCYLRMCRRVQRLLDGMAPTASGGEHLMDIEKLIERMNNHLQSLAAYSDPELAHTLEDAATALSTLQAEIKRLNKIVCSIPTTPDSGRTVSQYDKEMSICAYLDDLEAENEKLRGELEQVKAEKDAAVESIPHECKTCVYHTVFFNGCTLDHDCTNPDGGCSNNYDRWIWRGQRED